MGLNLFNRSHNDAGEFLKCKAATEEKIKNNDLIYRSMKWKKECNGIQFVMSADSVALNAKDTKEIMDGAVWESRAREIFSVAADSVMNHNSKYCPKPTIVEISLRQDYNNNYTESEKKITNDNDSGGKSVSNDECIYIRKPRWNFDDVYLPKQTVDEIKKTLMIARHKNKLFNEWKLGDGKGGARAIVFNFYGPSGTGKSMTAEAIAGELKKNLYVVNYAELESKYVGETPKNIVAVFKRAKKENAIIVFDEADSFLGKRLTNVTQSSDYGVNVTRSVMLVELEKFDGIVIFTTNLISNYDEAFKRRILASIPFYLPDEEGRECIWNIYLNNGITVDEKISGEMLAQKYSGLSGADIKDMLLYAAVSALSRDEEKALLNQDDFEDAYKIIEQRKKTEDSADNGMNIKVIKHEKISEEQYLKETENSCD